MGKLNIFEITLSNPQGVCFSGQIIQGFVTVELSQAMKMRGIRLHFTGSANVHWTEQHTTGSGKNRRTETRHYSANETYFSQILVLYGKAPGASGDNPIHPVGRFTYHFQFQLPNGIPSSFEGTHGRVRYFIKGVIDKPWKFDHSTKQAFTVINLLDLNMDPFSMTSPQGQNSKTLCCCCCESGPIEAICKLDRGGYVPGESIAVNAEVTNGSNRKINRITATLIQTITFHATSKSRTSHQTVAQLSHDSLEPRGSDVWSGDLLHIPPIPPSRLDGCTIIDITYILKFSVDPSGPAFDLDIPMPILIGSIPLQHIVQQYRSNAHPQPVTGQPPSYGSVAPVAPEPSAPPPGFAPPLGGAYGGPPPGFAPPLGGAYGGPPPGAAPPGAAPSAPPLPADVPPPSYAECVFGKVNIRDDEDNDYTKGTLDFTPRYTYYNWDNNATQYSNVNK